MLACGHGAQVLPEHPFELLLVRLAQRGCRFRRRGSDRARAICPNHRDQNPSLALTRLQDKVLVKCFAGCRTSDVVQALGLRMADLFTRGAIRAEPRALAATYDYCDLDGNLIAQKVRFAPKSFRWRRPDALAATGWRWGLAGLSVGLYRLPELVDCHRIFCLEGEKGVDFFWSLGLPATCPPAGASTWSSEWTADLWRAGCEELVILPDADPSGNRHSERVALMSNGFARNADEPPMLVKVISLPGLKRGEDAFDWLNAGHDGRELVELASDTPFWEPGAAERARIERRRRQTKERVRRLRDRRRAARNSILAQGERQTSGW